MPPKNSGGSTKFPGGHKVIHRTAQTAFVRVVTPRRICNDMSLSFITFLSISKYVFNISVLKWARFGIIDRCLDCYLHQRLVCLVVKLSFVSLGLLTLLTFKVCLFHLFGYQQDIRLSH